MGMMEPILKGSRQGRGRGERDLGVLGDAILRGVFVTGRLWYRIFFSI